MSGSRKFSCRLCLASPRPPCRLTLKNAPAAAQLFPKPGHKAQGRTLRLFQCAACGLVQLDNPPVPYWRQVITAASFSPGMRAARTEQMRDFLARFALAGKKILEIGCGNGYLLPILRELGAHPVGTVTRERIWRDLSPELVRERLGEGVGILRHYPGDKPPGERWDAFVCLNFLEHAPDPNRFLRGIAGLLTEDGVGLVEVPALEQMLEQRRFHDLVADHLCYYGRESLTLALEKNGFQVLETARARQGENLVAWVRKRPLLDLPRAGAGLHRTARALATLVASLHARGLRAAVWGASHQALTLLALSRAQPLAYVVDSAPFKQGRLTPVTHLPIRPPAVIREDPVEAVIIMASGYAREIAAQLRDLGFTGRLHVLGEEGFPPFLEGDPA